ncbi:MAG TPA: hypothetical protein VHQ47_00815 [Phycisphaerae bacterium]|jgi:hypothetical protein|nr:hypothetical protein [Phycisphaerae bacterium]
METIDDIRREEGNPRGSGADGIPEGKPVPLNRAFSEVSVPRAASLITLFLGFLSMAAGAVTFIVYFWIAAFIFLVAALVLFIKTKRLHEPTSM